MIVKLLLGMLGKPMREYGPAWLAGFTLGGGLVWLLFMLVK